MNLSAPFIRRPVATALLMVGLLLCGLAAYRLMPVSSLPNVNYPTIAVSAQLPGADPETMASSVATPLEQQFTQIPGVTQLTSSSALGITQITVQFDLGRDVDGAAEDVLAAINAASPYLPVGIPYPPTIRKVNPADTPILVLALTYHPRAERHEQCGRLYPQPKGLARRDRATLTLSSEREFG